MANTLLAPVYQDVYGEQFTSGDFSKRMKMQKLIYLLQEAGISIGDYNFHWYKHGPYSQQLQNDILMITDCSNHSIRYSETAKVIVSRLKSILNDNTSYRDDVWAECLASLQYLRSSVCPTENNEGKKIFIMPTITEEIVKKLQERKPHLNNKSANMRALSELKLLYN